MGEVLLINLLNFRQVINNKHFSHAVSGQHRVQDAIAAPKKAKVVKTSPKSRNNPHGRL
jgi:hypothetical protein